MMEKDIVLAAEEALESLDNYQSAKIKEAAEALRAALNPIIERTKKKERRKEAGLESVTYENYEPFIRVQQVIGNINNAIKTYEAAAEVEQKTHKRTQDILHAIELLDLSEEEMIGMVRELRSIRQVRREAKDFTDVMLPLYDVACKHQHIVKDFQSAWSEMQKIAAKMERRGYTPREKTELTDKFEQLKLVK